MKFKLQAIKLSKSLTLTFKNKKRGLSNTIVFTDNHLNYKYALDFLYEVTAADLFLEKQKVTEEDYEFFKELHDTSNLVKSWSNGDLEINSVAVRYKGVELNDHLGEFLLEKFLRNPHDTSVLETWSCFIKSINNSSSNHVVERLFTFLSNTDLYVSDDGEHVLAWKIVRSDYKDKYTGTMDNSVGQTLSVPHNQVEIDPNKSCSKGLHVCSLNYLKTCYASTGDRLIIVKVPISNILSIPYDYDNGAKVRTCGYTVIADAGVWGEDVDGDNYPDLSKYGQSANLD